MLALRLALSAAVRETTATKLSGSQEPWTRRYHRPYDEVAGHPALQEMPETASHSQ
jgi:hypothetical protein